MADKIIEIHTWGEHANHGLPEHPRLCKEHAEMYGGLHAKGDINDCDVCREGTWMTVYSVDRCYGGPEEGGWYYDWYSAIESVKVPPRAGEEELDAIRAMLNERNPGDNPGRFSVIGGADAVIYHEIRPGSNKSTHRPHYE